MPSIPFVQLKNTIRQMHADFGDPISSREAHRIAQGVMLSQCAEQFANAAEAYFREVKDPTGEEATDNVLIQYLIERGSLAKAA
ncbi:hypothetical protein [Sinomonas susongensis]|uniref:hypothetical protein n=1 Tax=Sinomonas susongensis TaxID=1324851 RepID=UPI00110A02CE|nr:hypothetical protein [Sinomonas susongensis]